VSVPVLVGRFVRHGSYLCLSVPALPEGLVPTLVRVKALELPGSGAFRVAERAKRAGGREYRLLCIVPGRGRRLPAALLVMALSGQPVEIEVLGWLVRARRVPPPPPPEFRPGATCAERLLAYLEHAGGCAPWAPSDLVRLLRCQPSTLKAARRALEERGLIYETADMAVCLRARS